MISSTATCTTRSRSPRYPGGAVLVHHPVRQPNTIDAADPATVPRAGSQSYPTPAAETDPDGSTTLHFAPTKPEGVPDGNWIQTDPEAGAGSRCLRLYSPLQAFFDKSWQVGEIERA